MRETLRIQTLWFLTVELHMQINHTECEQPRWDVAKATKSRGDTWNITAYEAPKQQSSVSVQTTHESFREQALSVCNLLAHVFPMTFDVSCDNAQCRPSLQALCI